jgi:flagellar motor switch protein FliN
MSAPDTDNGRTSIAQQFTRAWESVLATMAPAPTEAELESVPEGSAGEVRNGWSWWALAFDIAPAAPVLIGAPASSWQALGKLILGDDGSAGAEAEAVSKDLINQCGSVMAQWFSGETGHPVVCQDAVTADPGASEPRFAIHLKCPETGSAIRLVISVPEALAGKADPLSPAAAAPGSALAAIVLTVEVILGRITLQLADVLKLTVGSMLDLEHHVAEPVELVVNGQVVAWGQIVVCAGNYGVKITAKAKAREAA